MKTSEPMPWRRESRRVLHDGFLRLVQDTVVLPGGQKLTYESLDQGETACVLARWEGSGFLLVRQYRYVLDSVTLEIPMGGVNESESSEDAARRELREETGFLVGELTYLGTVVPSNGQSQQAMKLYFGEVSGQEASQPEISEAFELVWASAAELLKRATSGEITDAATLVAIFQAASRGLLEP